MVLFNYSTRELTAKVVYYGPGLCGKTTNLQYIYDNLPDNVKKGKMLSLATKTDRTLFFDFLPIELGMIRGMKTRVQLYTVPGQVFYNSTRKLVLKGADGVVFVADSQGKMLEANAESYKNLEDNLREMSIRLEEIPLVMQFNKRDLPNLSSVEEMNTQINRHNAPFYEAVATTGIGVEDTLKAITKLVLNHLASKYKLEGAAPEAAPAGSAGQRAARPGPRPVAAPPPPIPVSQPLPEDLALDALEVAGTQAIPVARAAVGGARREESNPASEAAARRHPVAPLRPAPVVEEEPLDLGEDLDLGSLDEPADGSVNLGEDLLVELEGEPPEPPVPVAPSRGGAARRPAVVEEEPLDLDEPIDLGEAVAVPVVAAGGVIDLGRVAPGQERILEIPVNATIDGRPVRLNLRVTVRLSR
jgi:hypothetical protein